MAQRHISMRKFHKINALILMAFAVLHIGNHMFLVAGRETYNHVQDLVNNIYRLPVVEPLLIMSISMQVFVGLVLIVRSLRQKPKRKFWKRGFWEKLQIISGLVFAWFVVEHLWALGLVRWFTDLHTTFYWPASVMNDAPFVYYFAPYYFFGVLALCTHIGIGLRYWAVDAGKPKLGERLGFGAIGIGIICGIVIVLSLTGRFYDITLPPEWVDYLKSFYPAYTPS